MLNHAVCSLTASYFPLNRPKVFTGGHVLQFEVLQQAMNELKSCLASFPGKPQSQPVIDDDIAGDKLLLNNTETEPNNFVMAIIKNIKQCTQQLLSEEI